MKVSPSFIGEAFCSLTQSSKTRVLHVVDLVVFCGIFASFLARIAVSYSSDPTPGIFFICKEVG